MKCTKCGFEFTEGIFCPECGTKYEEEMVEVSQSDSLSVSQAEVNEAKSQLTLEQEKVKNERLKIEAELIRERNESARLEKEQMEKKAIEDAKRQEEMTRSFNGTVYNTVEEMQAAKTSFEIQETERKEKKKKNALIISSFVLSIVGVVFSCTACFSIPFMIVSVVLGIIALGEKPEKKGLVVAAFVMDGFALLLVILFGISTFLSTFFGGGKENSSVAEVSTSYEQESIENESESDSQKKSISSEESDKSSNVTVEDDFIPMNVTLKYDGTINEFLYNDYICYADQDTSYDLYANLSDYSENGKPYSIMMSYYETGNTHADEFVYDLEQTDNGYSFTTSSGRKIDLVLVSMHSFALTSDSKNTDSVDWCGYYFLGDRYAARRYNYEAMDYSGGYDGVYGSKISLSAATDTDCAVVGSVDITDSNGKTQNYSMYIANTDNAWSGQYDDSFEIHLEDGSIEYLCFYYGDGIAYCGLCSESYNLEIFERTELYAESLGSGYILPESNTRYLDESELYNLSEQELTYARNEIYARHGRKFKDESLVEYFTSKSWYVPMYSADEFDESIFNDYEIKNRDLIVQYEKKIK